MISAYLPTCRPAVVAQVFSTPAGRTDPFISTGEGEDDDERWRRSKFNTAECNSLPTVLSIVTTSMCRKSATPEHLTL